MKYINKEKLEKAINEYSNKEDMYNDNIDDTYNIINDLCDTYNFFQGDFDFTPYMFFAGANYIYIIARRKLDNLEFIIDGDFFIDASIITKNYLMSIFEKLDTLLQEKVKEYKL